MFRTMKSDHEDAIVPLRRKKGASVITVTTRGPSNFSTSSVSAHRERLELMIPLGATFFS